MSQDQERVARELRALPAVDRVIDALGNVAPHAVTAEAARRSVDHWRGRIRAGEEAPDPERIVADARALLDEQQRRQLGTVLNATGVLIHTNLGRVPLGAEQLRAVSEIAGSYSNLEYDLAAGTRGSRYAHATEMIRTLTGAEAALVVNNNAAAVLLVLASLCSGKEVLISRGELIEIGGEFRIPEIMAASGARLVEVGTTNRTHIGDYERAITQETGAVLKVHPSNYRVVGFTAAVSARDLARLTRGRGIMFIHDVGSGLVGAPEEVEWIASEPPVDVALAEGADVVTCSGDKLLGGPQAGIIAGRRRLLERISKHPLLRAVRVDKMTLAALEATLRIYLEDRAGELPLWSMATAPAEQLERRAQGLASSISAELGGSGVKAEAVPSTSLTGGGSLPGTEVSSWAVALVHPTMTASEIARALRRAETPVIARIDDDTVLLDLRTVDPHDDPRLASIVASALRG